MCLILFVAATVSFPKQKALITNFADFSSIFLVPLLLRFAVKDQKNKKQLHRNPAIQPQKYVVKCDIRLSREKFKNKNSFQEEMVTIIDQSTARYNRRSEAGNKNNEIIVDDVDKVNYPSRIKTFS